MTEDGLFPIEYGKFLERVSGLGVVEADGDHFDTVAALGCRALQRRMMGLGTPWVIVRADGPETVLQAVEVAHALEKLNLSVESYLEQ